MQRPPYNNPPPPTSPPLHHPVPQHVSTVPQLRSPPPPIPQQQSQPSYGYPQQQQGGNAYMHPQWGNFINDPTAQMGFQVGASAVRAGQQYMEQNFNQYVNVSAIKHYFNVTNTYVLRKLLLVLFPWRHRPWIRSSHLNPTTQETYYLPPREDINSPDMYIPVMAFVTYILLHTLLAGLRGAFHPEVMGGTAAKSFAIVVFEILGLKLGCYLLAISNESQLYDLVAYSGYKFVGVIGTLVVAEVVNGGKGTGGALGWAVFFYTWAANSFFLLRSLKYVLLPDNSGPGGQGANYTVARSQKNRRTNFLFIYSFVVQLVCMWILSR